MTSPQPGCHRREKDRYGHGQAAHAQLSCRVAVIGPQVEFRLLPPGLDAEVAGKLTDHA
jgi:hypothetical protein